MRAAWLALGLLVACGGKPCTDNAGCPAPLQCIAERCVASGLCVGSASCASDLQCGPGQHCANGCCAGGDSGTCGRDSDCSAHPDTPVCDTGAGRCVQCLVARDCGMGSLCTSQHCVAQPGCWKNADCKDPALPVCDFSQHACVECVSSLDCGDPAKPSCDVTHHCTAAQQCAGDGDCAKPTPRCLLPSGRCVACLSGADCVQPLVCDSTQNTCVKPAATTCTTEADCASNPAAPHCNAGKCVACVDDTQCAPGQICTAQNACAAKTCAGDGDCAAPVPRCDPGSRTCVACLGNTDCPNGGTCNADHTCTAASSACTSDKDCALNVADPHCDTASGQCVECNVAADCGAGKTCTAHTCVNTSCGADADCASLPATPYCSAGQCVACVTNTECGSGYVCASNLCEPVCTAATQAKDCPAAAPYCREQPYPQCVQCLQSTQCPSGDVCTTSNTCVVATGCTSSATCPPTTPVCDTNGTHQCVQCLTQADCTNGMGCDAAAHTCTLSGGEGQVCNGDGSCNGGLLCVNEGGANGPVCRAQCDPYAPSCASGRVCSWLGFDDSGAFYGDCAPPNGHGGLGAGCDPAQFDSCEWNLVCAPQTAKSGICAAVCDPAGSSGCTCNAIVGSVSAAGDLQQFGYCGPASRWGQACTSDSALAGPDCGSSLSATGVSTSLYCAPSYLPADPTAANIVTVCQPTPYLAAGGAGDSCASGDSACRTGICLSDGPATCFAGCSVNADCGRDGASSTVKCFDVDFVSASQDNVIATCEPTCRYESDCAIPGSSFGRTCAPQPTHPGSSWQAVCSPVAGSGAAGAGCTSSSDCASGICVTGRTMEAIELGQSLSGFSPTDGFCLGSCVTSADCTVAGTVCSATAALPLFPANGDLGVMGKPSPGVCWPQGCTRDAMCTGLSADSASPRVCAPYKTTSIASTESSHSCASDTDCTSGTCNSASNNPNPGGVYGPSAGIYGMSGKCRDVQWTLSCAPSLGGAKGGAGAACTYADDCQSGHCVNGQYCFGGCSSNSDCKGGTCKAGNYLGLGVTYCQP